MREIKFRCWFPAGTDTGNGEIEKGEMCYDLDFENYEPINDLLKGVDHLMQFTGLKDKNGKEIYEGDIVDNKKTGIWEVVYHNGAFKFKIIKGKNINYSEVLRYFDYYDVGKVVVVIGNIYENPELIK